MTAEQFDRVMSNMAKEMSYERAMRDMDAILLGYIFKIAWRYDIKYRTVADRLIDGIEERETDFDVLDKVEHWKLEG